MLNDKDILSTILNNLSKIIRGPIVAIFILYFISPVEQGYWYVFQSLMVFVVLGDIGISKIVTLKISEYKSISTSSTSRLDFLAITKDNSSFILISFLLFLVLILLTSILLSVVVLWIFQEWPSGIKTAWIYCSIFSSFSLLNSLQSSIYYGSGLVTRKNILEICLGISFSLSVVILLYLNFGLYSLIYSVLFSTIFSHLIFYKFYNKNFKKIWKYGSFRNGFQILIKTKTLQINYALTTISSLFVTSLIVPITMKVFNPILAGQLGFSLFVMSSIYSFSLIFDYIKYPVILNLVNQKKFKKLYSLIKQIFGISNILLVIGCLIFYLFIEYIPTEFLEIKNRILPYDYLILIFFFNIININIGIIASLVRAFHVEPYWKMGFLKVFTTSILFYIVYVTNSLKIFLALDLVILLLIFLPLTLFIGKKQLKIIYNNKHVS
tara:strand:+ start:695 stop:2008 length:1314 start_codon:yes stop_codon:yes gene_type:complete